ncbi:mannan endo-1,6-alpha-mannosidase [Schizosaccharomyces cryophilus OY26]|uniref:Mannan endo-1,6-alpha-mannosidase n=1 Tax=Schizosaccharomyces cryophilus (strain OY26 / ATCC MYA-4695 / CBS 11777 / NBRC 106824 / NRRL Y48691) TaxID=653667 RepID=S9X853_SCHCR|nr:mannan endo-1,6-alpha-mannosidase [Schizosaccharomyces cryophilus OY26]EPY49941.1 mannan endo-1,6-alpha-mannosidase [Schizosaccharomyces cryophilus OY26]
MYSLLIFLLSFPSFLCIKGFMLDPNDTSSVDEAAGVVADGLLNYYAGYKKGGTIGMFLPPAYWWEAGAAWNGLLNRYLSTGNSTYNDLVKTSMLYQVGENSDYMPSNFSTSEGNDDQAFWGLAAISAAEANFSNPNADEPQWLELAQSVFNQQVNRWDGSKCDGGIRWQITEFNSGFDYKNSVTNGAFFQLAARLARFTGNDTYTQWAEKVYNWSIKVGFVHEDYTVFDGTSTKDNCSSIETTEWTYNSGLYMAGAAFLYNHTGSSIWRTRTEGFVNKAIDSFFHNDVLYEPVCELNGSCNYDQTSFKGFLARFMVYTAQMASYMLPKIEPLLYKTAIAAAKACCGGHDGVTCGFQWWWFNDTWDGLYGLGEQLSALEAIQAPLLLKNIHIYNSTDGGSSTGDPMAGLYTPTVSFAMTKFTIEKQHWILLIISLVLLLLVAF